MKKKILICLSLVLSFLILVGCENITVNSIDPTSGQTNTVNPTVSTTANNSAYIKGIQNYVDSVLPLDASADFTLPDLSTYNGISVSWSSSISEVINNKWIYLGTFEDQVLVLTLTITYENETYTSTHQLIAKAITMETSEEKINYCIDYLEKNIVDYTSSNIKLNFEELEDIAKIEFSVNRSLINHNLWIYDFPVNSYELRISCNISVGDDTEYLLKKVTVLNTTNIKELPTLYITTENNQGIYSKEDYVTATCTMVEDGKNTFTDKLLGIRLRGNSTSTFEKKPYRMKFDKKISFFGLEENKSWVLLANYVDQSLMRNYIAFALGNQMDNLAWTPTGNFVEVYINNTYLGSYLLTEQVEVKDGRVEIDEESTDVNTGYLVELDNKVFEGNEGNEGWDWFYIGSTPYAIKSPETDDEFFNINQFNYIKNYLQTTQDALYAKAFNQTTTKDYKDYLDIDSAIDYFIVEELMKNVDVGYSSCYMYMDKDDILHMGPLWDFDLSAGNPGHLDQSLRGPEGWYGSRSDKNYWFHLLMKDPSFVQAFKERYNEVYESIIIPTIESIYDVYDITYYSAYKNFNTWNILGVDTGEWYLAPETVACKTYDQQVFYLYDYLMTRAEWLYNELN